MEEYLLIKKAKKGDKESLLKLIMIEKDDYYRLAYSYMKNENDAMNSLQDMIIKLYENIRELKDIKKFYSWSKTILVNICKDELKKKKRLVPISDYEKFDTGIDEDKDGDMRVEELLSNLEPIYEEVIRLHILLDYDYKSIARMIDIPLGTVKSRIYNGKKILERQLEEDEKYAR